MYAMKTALSASNTCSTTLKLPRTTRVETNSAARGTLMYRLIPASSVAAATPANSAQVVPIFATSSRIAALIAAAPP